MASGREAWSDDDVLVAIFAILVRKSGHKDFKIRRYILQPMLRDMQSRDEFSILNCFVFYDHGTLPYSQNLQNSIERLQIAGWLNWYNGQDWETLRIRPVLEDYFHEEAQNLFTADEISELEKIADYLNIHLQRINVGN